MRAVASRSPSSQAPRGTFRRGRWLRSEERRSTVAAVRVGPKMSGRQSKRLKAQSPLGADGRPSSTSQEFRAIQWPYNVPSSSLRRCPTLLLSAQCLPHTCPPSSRLPVTLTAVVYVSVLSGSEPSTWHTEAALEVNSCRVNRTCTAGCAELGGPATDTARAVWGQVRARPQ